MPLSLRVWIDARVEDGLTAQAIYNHVTPRENEIEEVECHKIGLRSFATDSQLRSMKSPTLIRILPPMRMILPQTMMQLRQVAQCSTTSG
jgi:hypothetical protein